MRLAERQAWFIARLAAEGDAAPAPGAGHEAYRRTVHANWRGALAAAYPACRRLVGESFFDACSDHYARAHPACDGDLNRYGESLAHFLEGYAHARPLEYLADVARLEWAVHRAGFAADPAPFDMQALAAVPAERLGATRLVAQPGTCLIESPHPIVSIWEANQPQRDGVPDAAWRAEAALVHRERLHVRVRRAGRDATLLRRLLAGSPLEVACADAADAAALPRWVSAGVFSGIVP